MNNVVPLRSGGVPAIFATRANLPDMNAAAQQGLAASFAIFGYANSKWSIKYRGDEEVMKDARGAPIPTLDVVIVGISPNISKAWYEKKFAQGDDSPPDCFSNDGNTPDPSSPKLQHANCAACPQNVYGSRMTDNGKKAKACQDSRRLAVVPAGDVENETYGGPMMLKLPPMSLAGLAKYTSELTRFAAQPFMVSTILGFDYDVNYPLLTFRAAGWLDDEQAAAVAEAMENPLIERILHSPGVTTVAPPGEDTSALAGGKPASAFGGKDGLSPSEVAKAAAAKQKAEAAAEAQHEAQRQAEAKQAAEAQAAQAAEVDEEAAALAAAEAALAAAKAKAAAKLAAAQAKAAAASTVVATPPVNEAAPPPKKPNPFASKATTVAATVAAATTPAAANDSADAETAAKPVVAAAPPDLEEAINALLG